METAPSTGNNQTQQSICYCWPNNIITEQSIMVAIDRELKINRRMGKSIMPLFKSFELSLASSVSTVLHDQLGRYGNIHKIGRLKIYLFFFYLYKSNVHHYKLYKTQFFEYRTIQVCRKSCMNLNKFNAKILLIFQAR